MINHTLAIKVTPRQAMWREKPWGNGRDFLSPVFEAWFVMAQRMAGGLQMAGHFRAWSYLELLDLSAPDPHPSPLYISLSGWWLTYPSEKYESQSG